MLHSYCSRENYSSQTSFRQVDSGQPLNDECPVSEESTSTNPKLLQCLLNQMQSYPRLWDKACREKIHAQKKRLTYINIVSILGIDGKSIRKLVIRWPKSILRVACFRVIQLVIVNYEVLPREKEGKRERGGRGGEDVRVPFLYSQKTSENLTVFWCFQRAEKGCIGNEWVKFSGKSKTFATDKKSLAKVSKMTVWIEICDVKLFIFYMKYIKFFPNFLHPALNHPINLQWQKLKKTSVEQFHFQ